MINVSTNLNGNNDQLYSTLGLHEIIYALKYLGKYCSIIAISSFILVYNDKIKAVGIAL